VVHFLNLMVGLLLNLAHSVGQIFWANFFETLSKSIRRTKHGLIIKLITRMDGKSRDGSIKPN
jgi:hypothetical protein